MFSVHQVLSKGERTRDIPSQYSVPRVVEIILPSDENAEKLKELRYRENCEEASCRSTFHCSGCVYDVFHCYNDHSIIIAFAIDQI